ncbi:DUF563 domain-containing protein [Synechococcus sp. A15-60]|uniref:glycosyltransferase family 61 protein n=1 Tax=Synechococcus sp. A15-60 TaxID=1050655 RepID=UPI00164689A6|nr:glycosyltransferase 61 family protein [Synechococcus sp. A15-60]
MAIFGDQQQKSETKESEAIQKIEALISQETIEGVKDLYGYAINTKSECHTDIDLQHVEQTLHYYYEIRSRRGKEVARLCINRLIAINLVLDPCNPELRIITYLLNQKLKFISNWQSFDILDIPFNIIRSAWETSLEPKTVNAQDFKKSTLFPQLRSPTDEFEMKGIFESKNENKIDRSIINFRNSLQLSKSCKDQNTYYVKGNFLILSTGYGIVIYDIDRDAVIESHSHHSTKLLGYSLKIRYITNSSQISNCEGLTAICTVRHAPNYAHWTRDVLSKLLHIKAKGISFKINNFIFDNIEKKYQLDTLKMLDIDKKNIINSLRIPPSIILKANRIVLPPKFDKTLSFSTTEKWFQELAEEKEEEKIKHGGHYLYLSRDDAEYRKVLNEEELQRLLKQLNFETIKASNLTIFEQISLFSNARIVVGAHSAGLINCLYSKHNLSLIELHHPDYCHHGSGLTMAQMACYCKFNYYPIKCKSPVRSDDLTDHYKKDIVRTADIEAPLDLIQQTLMNIL